ncbi:MAG: hypothetical protein OEW11_10290 [Nitrospirota bacterium]|nr:hypothetical protein [Nitrospirota bacterium]
MRSGAGALGRNLLLAAFFLAVLVAPLINLPLVSPQDIAAVEQVEKRRMADFPGAPGDVGALRVWPGRFESWFGDHMGLRRALVRMHNRVVLFGLGTSPSPLAIAGKNGWLFYAHEASLRSYRREFPFTSEQLVVWQQTLEARRDWLGERGIRYLFVVVPDKEVVYGEFMPDRITRQNHPARLDQFVEHMAAHSSVEVLDLRPALLAEKAASPHLLYRKTDTHWGDLGAYVGYREIMRRIATDFPASAPHSLADFTLDTRVVAGGGLAGLFDLSDTLTEPLPRLTPRFDTCRKHEEVSFAGNFTWFTERGPVRTECGRDGLPSAVFFRDSFADAMLPLLTDHFAEAVYIVNPFTQEIMDQVLAGRNMAQRPDVVVEQIVQRKFYMLEPQVEPEVRQAMLRLRFLRDGTPLVTIARPEGWIVVANREGQSFTLPPLRVGAGNWPVVRLELESPVPATLRVAFRNGGEDGLWETDAATLTAGHNEVFFALPLVGFDGPLAMLPPVVPGGLRVFGVEVRGVPLDTRPAG